VQHANNALATRPDSAAILELMVSLERDRKRLPEAIALAQRLVETEPSNDRYYFTLGALKGEAGDRAASLDAMRKAIDLNPKNAAALNYLGYSYAEAGENLDEAEQLIRRALEVDPNDGFYIDSLGWVYYQRGEYQRAVEELEKAAELSGDDPTVNEHLADAYRRVGREFEAQRVYREAMKKAEDSAQKTRIEDKLRSVESAAKPTGRNL
jgi:Flp pilus assembly protein TadD